jgi:spoIIIJ-associated protein
MAATTYPKAVAAERNEKDEVGVMKSAEGRGRTLDEAVDAALIELGESRRNVDVKVLNEGPEETVVEVTVIDHAAASAGAAPVDGNAEVARTLVDGLLKHMGIRAQVTARPGSDPTTLDISGRDLGALIGWRGETLRALQSVTNVMVGRHLGEGERIIVDVERYRQRREHTVREIALRAARQVKMTGDAITLDAMQPFERRAIHLALEGDPEVTSSSIGEEPERRVVVGLRKPAAE